MRKRIVLGVLLPLVLIYIGCGPPPEPKEYIHTSGGFKFTAAAGWKKTADDDELMEFRRGNNRLVEVGAFDLGVTPDELTQLGLVEFTSMIQLSAREGLDGYCDEANIKNYTVSEEEATTFAGLPGYRIKATGHSGEVSATVVVDILIGISKSQARAFMYSSQVIESEYSTTLPDLMSMIASFQLL